MPAGPSGLQLSSGKPRSAFTPFYSRKALTQLGLSHPLSPQKSGRGSFLGLGWRGGVTHLDSEPHRCRTCVFCHHPEAPRGPSLIPGATLSLGRGRTTQTPSWVPLPPLPHPAPHRKGALPGGHHSPPSPTTQGPPLPSWACPTRGLPDFPPLSPAPLGAHQSRSGGRCPADYSHSQVPLHLLTPPSGSHPQSCD